jgi:putative ABC transport system permease protein
VLSSLTQDLRFAARNLWRNGGFAASAVLILAIGIAASTGLFAIIDAVVLHPLPYADADRLARVQLLPSSGPPRPATVTADEFLALQRAATLDGAYIKDSFAKTLAGTSFAESVWTEYYTGNALPLLGVRPLIGRVFTEAEAPLGRQPQRVAVLTHRFWQRHFAGQPNAIGQTLRLDGEPFTVIGVLPADYSLDLTDIVLPLPMTFDSASTWPVLVRMDRGATRAAAEEELQQIYERFAQTRPDAFPRSFRVQVRRLVDEERGAAHVPILGLLFVAAALLLLIGCANVTILLLARGRNRVHEIALRYALGARRSRLVSLLLGETAFVTLIATALALLLVGYLLPVLLEGVPGVVSRRAGRIIVGPAAFLFATSLTMLVVLGAGLWPALAVSRARSDAMRRASTVRAGASAGGLGSGFLIAAQVTIAVVLLSGTGAATRTLMDLYRAPAGYDPTRMTVAQIYLPIGRYTTWPDRVALYERLRMEVASESSSESSTLSLIPTGPPPRTGVSTRIEADGLRAGDREVLAHSVASDYFSTLRMPLARGRVWSASDDVRADAVTVINETMARQLWPGEDPIGKLVRDRSFDARRSQWVLNAPGRDGWFEVIGVVRDAPNRGLREPIAPAMYYPYTASLSDTAVLLVRTKGSPAAAERDLRIAVSRADGNLPIVRFITPDNFMGWQQGEFVTAVLFGFGGVALFLSSFGLFSVSCYSVAHRTREFGIRIALGAAPAAVLRSALQSVAIAVIAGLAIGLTLSVALDAILARWSIRNMDDPLVLAGVVGLLVVSMLVATMIPARRATSIEPGIALRAE